MLIDTGVFLAYADTSDPDHSRCLSLLDGAIGDLLTPPLVVAETGWLIERQLGPDAEADCTGWIAAGDLLVEPLTLDDWARVVDLTRKYADIGLGGVDASVIAVAERLRLDTVAPLDQRHFRVVRPRHVETFTIIP